MQERPTRRYAEKIATLRAEARRWGWARAWFALLVRFMRVYAGIHLYRVNLRPLDRRFDPPALPGEIRVGRVPPETLIKAAQDPELAMDPEFVRAALERGDIAFGALDRGRLVSYAWRTFSAAPDFHGLWVRVDRPYHYAYKAFTLPEYRGRHLHIAVSLLCDETFRSLGYLGEVGFSELSNYSSIAAADALGRRRIGYAGYLKWFGHCIPFRTRSLAKIGFEFFKPEPRVRIA